MSYRGKGRGSRGKWLAWLSEGGGEFKVPDRTVVIGEKGRSSEPILILEGCLSVLSESRGPRV